MQQTLYGDDVRSRVQDRNARARAAEQAAATMKTPYPSGYTGHIAQAKTQLGLTYDQQSRLAINGVRQTQDPSVSTAQAAYISPDDHVQAAVRAASASLSAANQSALHRTAVQSIREATTSSTAQDSYVAPDASAYLPPPWTERATTNHNQPVPLGANLIEEAPVHLPEARAAAVSADEQPVRGRDEASSPLPASRLQPSPSTAKRAAGMPTRHRQL